MEFVVEAAGIKAVACRKNVKYIRISVKPPEGNVYISVPRRASLAAVRAFMEEKQDWIREKQRLCRNKANAVPAAGEDSALLWGERLPLRVETGAAKESASVQDGAIVLRMKEDTPQLRAALLDSLLRGQLTARIPTLAEKWEAVMGVHAAEWRTRRMKTRWGSCNTAEKRIWLNVRLAMLPPQCLEYVVVHELCHLHEPSHNARFKALMDGYYPGWRELRRGMDAMSGVLY